MPLSSRERFRFPNYGIVLLAVGLSCAPKVGPEKAAKVQPAPQRTEKTYTLVGVVRNVNAASGLVTIRHEAIAGFMDAMTMPFTVKDHAALKEIGVGDKVEGVLRVVSEGGETVEFDLSKLVVTEFAPPQSLNLSTSGGKASLTAVPQVLKPGDPVPDFTMTDQDGKTRKLSDFRGKVVALTFIYTRCPLPDFCPRMDRKFAELADRLSAVPGRAEGARLLSVSFDPEHDTPEVLKKHATTQGAKPPLWTFLVASHPELAKVAAQLGLTYGPTRDEIIHNLSIAVIDPDGRLVRLETGSAARSWETSDLLKTMAQSRASAER